MYMLVNLKQARNGMLHGHARKAIMQEEQAVAAWLPILGDSLDAQDSLPSSLLGAPMGTPVSMPFAC